MPLSETDREWYYTQIKRLDPNQSIVKVNTENHIISYDIALRSDESKRKEATPEECVRALVICMLVKSEYKYPVDHLYREKHYPHGRKGTLSDRVDLLIYDDDNLPYAMWEVKSAEEYEVEKEDSIKLQLFGTAPLVGTPKLLVYATIKPGGAQPTLTLICIDYTKFCTKFCSYERWLEEGKPCSSTFPLEYREIGYEPYNCGGRIDLRVDCTPA